MDAVGKAASKIVEVRRQFKDTTGVSINILIKLMSIVFGALILEIGIL